MKKTNQLKYMFVLCLLTTAFQANAQTRLTDGSFRLCDFHQHTTFTDGEYSMPRVFAVCDSIGLAWWSSSEHGGMAVLGSQFSENPSADAVACFEYQFDKNNRDETNRDEYLPESAYGVSTYGVFLM